VSDHRRTRTQNGLFGAFLAAGLCLGSGAARADVVILGADRTVNTLAAAPGTVPVEVGIPIPPRAQNILSLAPTPGELRSMLQAAGQPDLSVIRGLRAIVFRVSGPATAAEILRYYGVSQIPAARALGGGMGRAQAVAGPRSSVSVSQTGFRPLTNEAGYLIVTVSASGARAQDLQVTVARVTGPPAVAGVLDEVATIVDRNVVGGRRNADVDMFTFPGSDVERNINLPGSDAPALIQRIATADLPADVRKMYGALLGNVQSISLTTYVRQGSISPEAFFSFYRKAAGNLAWGEVMADTKNPEAPGMIFDVGGHGVAWIRAELTGGLVPVAPGLTTRHTKMTRITLLILEGRAEAKAAGQGVP
jgi:hypothetical protein